MTKPICIYYLPQSATVHVRLCKTSPHVRSLNSLHGLSVVFILGQRASAAQAIDLCPQHTARQPEPSTSTVHEECQEGFHFQKSNDRACLRLISVIDTLRVQVTHFRVQRFFCCIECIEVLVRLQRTIIASCTVAHVNSYKDGLAIHPLRPLLHSLLVSTIVSAELLIANADKSQPIPF
ncbi:hypothetical protein BJV77DRAFT_966176 [Russula vinacea]|nr:hypothetical protein BJV77DRAFT_966176 [Russula vinacea]